MAHTIPAGWLLVVIATAAVVDPGPALAFHGGVRHLGGPNMHFGGAMPGSGHRGRNRCRRCR